MIFGAFASLAPEALQQLRAAGRTLELQRGELLFQPSTPADTVYLLLSGSVRLYALAAGGREVTLAVHHAGDLLVGDLLGAGVEGTGGAGSQGAGGDASGLHTFYAETTAPTQALALAGRTVAELMRGAPELQAAFQAALVKQTAALYVHFESLVFCEVSQRLAAALLERAERPPSEAAASATTSTTTWDGCTPLALPDRLSHQELAHMVGSTRETVTKLLGEFRSRELLELGYRRIILTDKAGLEAAARRPLR